MPLGRPLVTRRTFGWTQGQASTWFTRLSCWSTSAIHLQGWLGWRLQTGHFSPCQASVTSRQRIFGSKMLLWSMVSRRTSWVLGNWPAAAGSVAPSIGRAAKWSPPRMVQCWARAGAVLTTNSCSLTSELSEVEFTRAHPDWSSLNICCWLSWIIMPFWFPWRRWYLYDCGF